MYTILQATLQELDIFFSFSWRDWSVAPIPGLIFAVGATHGLPLVTIIQNYIFLLSWLTFYLYLNNLTGQIRGVEEDKINKPDRPIPSGKVSLEGAIVRLVIVVSIFLNISIYEPSVFSETLTWISITAFMCTPWGNHWFGKNMIAMSFGTWALLSASWKLIAPHTPKSEASVYAISAWVSIIAPIQDLRDIEGDALIGRKTMPIVYGDWETRLLISFVIIPISIYILHLGHIVENAPWTLIALHIALAYRVLQMRGPRYDHKTYMYLTYTFCVVCATVAVLPTMQGINFMALGNNTRV